MKKHATGRGNSIGSITHVEMHPPRTILCTACGEKKHLEPYAHSLTGIRSFNQQVYEFAEAHRACEKEGK